MGKEVSYKQIIWLTLPATLSVAMEPLAELVDTAILGHVNTIWLACLAATNTTLGCFAWLFNFLSYGVTAQIAHSLGAGENRRLSGLIFAALFLAICIGVGMGVLLLFFGDQLLSYVMGAKGELLQDSQRYYFIRVLGYPLTILSIAFIGILRGLQKIKLSMCLVFTITIINAVGTYLSVFHFGWGIKGAAWSTVLSFLVGDCIAFVCVWRFLQVRRVGGFPRFNRYDFKALSSDGLNLAGRTGLLSLSFFILTACVTRLGTSVLAAYQVVLQIWLLTSYCMDGLSITATSLGGRLIGRGERVLHKMLSQRLLIFALCGGLGFTLFYLVFASWVQGVFTNSPEVMMKLNLVWGALALSQSFNTFAYVFDGILFGFRAFVFLRKRMLEGFCFVFIPLALWGFLETQSLLGMILPLIGLNIYRLLTGWWGYRKYTSIFK